MTGRNGRPVPASMTPRSAMAGIRSGWLTTLRERLPRPPGLAATFAVRLVAAAGLAIDAYVHLDLASTYAEAQAPVNEGVLFRFEAVMALLAAFGVLLTGRRLVLVLGLAISASALAVMLVSRYVDLGPLGPFPDLYEPAWFPEKLWAAFGEGTAVIACLAGILLGSIRAGRERSDRTQCPRSSCPRSSHRRFPRRW
jgi:hypothetical protein